MQQAVTIRSSPRAFEFVKAMQAQGLEWSEGYRGLGRMAISAILQGQMTQAVDEHLDRMALLDQADRRNGSYRRPLLTELGDIELAVPRTRQFAPIAVMHAYARRPEQVDRMILACFVFGLSVRKVSKALLPILGRPISPYGEHGGQAARSFKGTVIGQCMARQRHQEFIRFQNRILVDASADRRLNGNPRRSRSRVPAPASTAPVPIKSSALYAEWLAR